MGIRGVLFDIDGTLVDTNYLHTVAWWEALLQGGHEVPMARIHRAIGMGADKILEHLLGPERDLDADKRISDAHVALYAQYWPKLRPLPGARELLYACTARRFRVVLASSASGEELSVLRKVIDADDVVYAATSAEDVEESKPEPDILKAALKRSGLSAQEVVYVGDSVWDVRAAARLGIPCIGLTCGGLGPEELVAEGAVTVFSDPADLAARIERSPLSGD
jgi:HAD superfamily hydrolase (TIGR01509 family)